MPDKKIKFYYVSTSEPYIIRSTSNIDKLTDLLYNSNAKLLSDSQIIEKNLDPDYNSVVKSCLSSNLDRVPLYDIRSNNIFLIYWQNVYPRIYFDDYRFIDKKFIKDLMDMET